MRHIGCGIRQGRDPAGGHCLQEIRAECHIGFDQFGRILRTVRSCIIGRQVIHKVRLRGLYRTVDTLIGSVNRQQAEPVLKPRDIRRMERCTDKSADLIFCRERFRQMRADIAGDPCYQDSFHALSSIGHGPYCRMNSANSGSFASLSDKITFSTCSTGQFTASCGSSQRMPPSDAGSYRSPHR